MGDRQDKERHTAIVDKTSKNSWHNKETVALYANGKGQKILGGVIERIVSEYDYSAEWLLTGKGEPFPGAREEHPEVCGPEDTRATPHINKPVTFITQTPATDAEPLDMGRQFVEDINHLKVIYDYGDPEIINAIHSNLRTFNRAVQCEIEVTELKSRIDSLERSVEQLMAERDTTEKKTANGTDV